MHTPQKPFVIPKAAREALAEQVALWGGSGVPMFSAADALLEARGAAPRKQKNKGLKLDFAKVQFHGQLKPLDELKAAFGSAALLPYYEQAFYLHRCAVLQDVERELSLIERRFAKIFVPWEETVSNKTYRRAVKRKQKGKDSKIRTAINLTAFAPHCIRWLIADYPRSDGRGWKAEDWNKAARNFGLYLYAKNHGRRYDLHAFPTFAAFQEEMARVRETQGVWHTRHALALSDILQADLPMCWRKPEEGDDAPALRTKYETGVNAKLLHADDTCVIVQVLTQNAARAFGYDTDWCTSYQDRSTFFGQYAKGLVVVCGADGVRHAVHLPRWQWCNQVDAEVEPKVLLEHYPPLADALVPFALEEIKAQSHWEKGDIQQANAIVSLFDSNQKFIDVFCESVGDEIQNFDEEMFNARGSLLGFLADNEFKNTVPLATAITASLPRYYAADVPLTQGHEDFLIGMDKVLTQKAMEQGTLKTALLRIADPVDEASVRLYYLLGMNNKAPFGEAVLGSPEFISDLVFARPDDRRLLLDIFILFSNFCSKTPPEGFEILLDYTPVADIVRMCVEEGEIDHFVETFKFLFTWADKNGKAMRQLESDFVPLAREQNYERILIFEEAVRPFPTLNAALRADDTVLRTLAGDPNFMDGAYRHPFFAEYESVRERGGVDGLVQQVEAYRASTKPDQGPARPKTP